MKTVKCIHCLQDFPAAVITKDHVLPKSWYPTSTPTELERWHAPSCKRCNERLSTIEEDLLTLFALCLDRNDPSSAGIFDKAFRSMSPECGRDNIDRKRRGQKRKRIQSKIHSVPELPRDGYLPNFGPSARDSYGSSSIAQFPVSWLEEFGRKMVKGVLYALDSAYIPADSAIDIIFANKNAETQSVRNMLENLGEQHFRGSSWYIGRGISPDGVQSIYHIVIWNRFEFYASVTSSGD